MVKEGKGRTDPDKLLVLTDCIQERYHFILREGRLLSLSRG